MYALYAPHLPFGAALPATATTATLSSGIAAVRAEPCYSQALDDCINTTGPSTVPGCEAIRAGYKVDAKAMEAAVQSLKYCSAPSPLTAFVAVGAIGVALGVLLGGLLR